MANKSIKPKVFVGMSGGVDSSVSAALLKKEGYDVTGVFIKVWSPDWLPCTWKEERRDAMRVAAELNISFLTFDFEKEYKQEVVDSMLADYGKGLTPNPDVLCNKEIKFGSFLNKAREMGAEYISTGHYARIVSDAPAASGIFRSSGQASQTVKIPDAASASVQHLLEGADKTKDQSYFLWTLNQGQLRHVLFPVGNLQKTDVRALAKKFSLPTAEKKDSQGICFIGEVEMREFLQHYIPKNPGDVLNEQGTVVGHHDGAVFFTLGERHGFEITEKSPHDEPYYVTAKDIRKNTLTVSRKTSQESHAGLTEALLKNVNWIDKKPVVGKSYLARFRYHQEPQKCRITLASSVVFEKPQAAVSPGQSLVIYEGETVVGGGVIS